MIIASAIKLNDGQIFVGKTHNAAIYNASVTLCLHGMPEMEQGFLTSKLEFLSRKEAYIYAKKTKQFKRRDTGNHYNGKELFSEDLW